MRCILRHLSVLHMHTTYVNVASGLHSVIRPLITPLQGGYFACEYSKYSAQCVEHIIHYCIRRMR